ncbi:MAG: ribonuclease III [Planctomycetes bacterium]|nr:ribonuclease III [Planctomycetota bacterium]
MIDECVTAAQRVLSYKFNDLSTLAEALTHASIADNRVDSNERLEFLGDAVLGMVVSECVFRRYPDLLEGEMTKLKSTAVSRQTCANIAREIGLDSALLLGKGMRTHSELPQSLAAAVFETVIAAIYLDGGYPAAEAFILEHLDPIIEQAAQCGHQENFKSVLQQHAQQQHAEPPQYRVLDEKGPDHAKCFKIGVELHGRRFEAAWGQTKKRAEQTAALNALRELGIVEQTEDGLLRVVQPAPIEEAEGVE